MQHSTLEENLTWLDGIAERNFSEAHEVAKRNENTEWGAEWLRTRAAAGVSAVLVKNTLSAGQIKIAKARGDLDSYVAKRAAMMKCSADVAMGKLMRNGDEQALKFYGAVLAAEDDLRNAPIEKAIAPIQAEIAKLEGEAKAEVAAFGMTFNLDPVAAEERLAIVNPAYAAKRDKLHELYSESGTVAAQAQIAAEQELAPKPMPPTVAKRNESTLEKRINIRVATLAAERGVSFSKALADAMNDDPVVQELYEQMSNEAYR